MFSQGDQSFIREDLCHQARTDRTSNIKGLECPCSSCPKVEVLKWVGTKFNGVISNTQGSYLGTHVPLFTGPECLSAFPGCQECHGEQKFTPLDRTPCRTPPGHRTSCPEPPPSRLNPAGNCCAKKRQDLIDRALLPGATTQDKANAQPECPTSSCPGNALWRNSARANHVGNCGSPAYVFSAGKCTSVLPPPITAGRRLLDELTYSYSATTGRDLLAASPKEGAIYTSISGPGYCVDNKKLRQTYYAFCDYEAYARVPGGNFGILYGDG
jgi:hypothetical protein